MLARESVCVTCGVALTLDVKRNTVNLLSARRWSSNSENASREEDQTPVTLTLVANPSSGRGRVARY